MKWQDIRQQFPSKWVVFQAIQSYTTDDMRRIVDEIAPINAYENFYQAWDQYTSLHKQYPSSELYVYHTSNEEVDIKMQHWVGIRR